MNKPSSQSVNTQVADSAATLLSADALARRRLLFKGAGGSAATLAALTPLGALAQSQSTVFVCKNKLDKDVMCTISGVQSAAHSFGPNIQTKQAAGRTVSYWGAVKQGSTTVPLYQWPTGVNPSDKTSTVFGQTVNVYWDVSLFSVVKDSSTSEMAHWITAYLNAKALSTTTFPYTAAQVVALYNDTQKRGAALDFFTGYLENLA